MQIKFFKIPISDIPVSEGELNKFLRSHRILQADRVFYSEQGGYWADSACALPFSSILKNQPKKENYPKRQLSEVGTGYISRPPTVCFIGGELAGRVLHSSGDCSR